MNELENSVEDANKSLNENCNVCEMSFQKENELQDHMKNHEGKGRTFSYDMNEKKAKKKLLKGSRRNKHLDIEEKPTCINMRFSDGAYHEVVLPLLKQWSKNVGKVINLQGNEIEVIESISGVDLKAKHMNTKLVIIANTDRIVIHVYNTTQNIMVQGKNFADFAICHLQPYFMNEISKSEGIIDQFNKNIEDMFGGKKISKQKSQTKKPFSCPNCKVKSSTVADLRMHMKMKHTLSGRNQIQNLTVLNEDISILDDSLDDSTKVTIEETTNIPEKAALKCDWKPCDFKSTLRNDLTKHIEDEHIPVLKKKYLPPDVKSQLEQSDNKEIGIHSKTEHESDLKIVQNLACLYCNSETQSKTQLEQHVEEQHINPTDANRSRSETESPFNITREPGEERENVVICGVCSRSFEGEINCLEHMQSHDSTRKIECQSCCIIFSSILELEWHNDTEHEVILIEKENKVDDIIVERSETCSKCPECVFIGNSSEIKEHTSRTHQTFDCTDCGKTFQKKNLIEEHITSHHGVEPFPCELCGLVLANFTLLQKHIEQVHVPNEPCQYCNFFASDKEVLRSHYIEKHEEFVILHTMANQMNELSGLFVDFRTFKEDVMNLLKANFETNNAIKQELFILRNNQAAQQTNTKNSSKTESSPAETHRNPNSSLSSSPSLPRRSTPQPKPRATSSPVRGHENQNVQQKLLYVGDSISANVDFQALKEGTKTEIKPVKAYSAVFDNESNVAKKAAYFPQKNFTDVIAKEVENEEFDTMIVQAGSVDISNFNTKNDPEKHFEYFHQQSVMSAKNIFTACENALRMKPSMKKVIIMKQIPRYDRPDMDPLSIKQALSMIFNNTLTEQWRTTSFKEKIFIGNHNIECSGGVRESRYRNIQTGAFDGIHLYGSSGKKAYTNSVLNILNQAGLINQDFDHQNCPQAQYQVKKNGFHNTNWTKDSDVRIISSKKQNQEYEIPIKNRFSSLQEDVQGNY